MRTLAIIPARYASTRFPAKLLAKLDHKSIIQRTYEQACQHPFEDIVVATDHPAIAAEIEGIGGQVVMTAPELNNGTERCAAALQILENQGKKYDVVVNIQGDEPFIQPQQLALVTAAFQVEGVEIATLIQKIRTSADIFNPNIVKAVLGNAQVLPDGTPTYPALYFSRQAMPYVRDCPQPDQWILLHNFYRHIGLYAFRTEILKKIVHLPESLLERAEKLEQLRWLQAGYKLYATETQLDTIGIDTPDDLQRAQQFLSKLG